MATRRAVPRTRAATTPVSVLLATATRRELLVEGRRRGLGISPTIRTLVEERMADLREERQLARARRWQLAQVLATWRRDTAGKGGDVPQERIDAIFREALVGTEGDGRR